MYRVLHPLGVGAVLICAGLAILAHPYQQKDPAYQRDKNEKVISAALADIMQPAPADSKAGNQQCKVEQDQNGRKCNRLSCRLKAVENGGDDHLKQHEVPILTASCAAAEGGILAENRLNSFSESHDLFLLFLFF